VKARRCICDKTTYDPITFPIWDTELTTANATALFAGGCDIELDTHARKVMKAAYDWAMRNLKVEQTRLYIS
jgi:hypothetical protein